MRISSYRGLRLPYEDMVQLYRRMIFNVLVRNRDDHTKNIVYLMDQNGDWRLSPTSGVICAFNPSGRWTKDNQMTKNGKRSGFSKNDLIHIGKEMGARQENRIINEIVAAVVDWRKYADLAGVDQNQAVEIQKKFRLFKR